MIQIKKISGFYESKNVKIKAVGPIDFNCEDDDICAIIGPSGCGKTTLLNILSGVNKNYEGEVFLNSEKLNPHTHKIGFIPQDFGLLPWKTVEENCLLPFKIRGEEITKDILLKFDSILKKLNIEELKKKYPNKLSGGQRQRISIVRAFLMEPDLLLIDEGFSALDAIIKEEAEELFLDMWTSNKINTFFVTHSIDEAIYMGKKIIIMSNEKGQIKEVINNDLFNNKEYKESPKYSKLFSHIKNLIKEGWDNK
ncbi:ATP-binding cassette domain-containing protein [Clostridium sp.]|uniref:ATP-binding cassette domain-containing protein n=1 Tax=Clostridium sp. TaxID=1506 RepID=UPI002FC939AB